MNSDIRKLEITGLRSLRRLTLSGLGKVNLITGRNNTGKSSVLEALQILSSNAAPGVLLDILRSREENVRESLIAPSKGWFPVSSFFWGFPEMSDFPRPIIISTDSEQLTIRVAWAMEKRDQDDIVRLIEVPDRTLISEDAVQVLIVQTADSRRISRLSAYFRTSRLPATLTRYEPVTCLFVGPYGGEGTAILGELWDKIALSDREIDIVDALRIIDPNISAVSMIGQTSSRSNRAAIVRSGAFVRPVPLRSFGDGLNRIFGMILSMVNAKDGRLLIDEFENGLHYSVQLDAWRTIFRLAVRLNVQVFATSHSWDAVESFQRAAAESDAEGVLIRLSRKGSEVIPTLFREDELALATRDGIEVR